MRFLRKNSLWILTIYAACVAIAAALMWDDLLLTQKCAAVMVVIACAHEWEEQRLPGDFLELMAKNMGLEVTDEQRASMLSKPDLIVGILTFLGFAVGACRSLPARSSCSESLRASCILRASSS